MAKRKGARKKTSRLIPKIRIAVAKLVIPYYLFSSQQ